MAAEADAAAVYPFASANTLSSSLVGQVANLQRVANPLGTGNRTVFRIASSRVSLV
jgi:hypothetical protein